eukprot:gene12083-biopygen9075
MIGCATAASSGEIGVGESFDHDRLGSANPPRERKKQGSGDHDTYRDPPPPPVV